MKRVAQQERRHREIAHELIDEFVADGRCDLMQQYCYPYRYAILRMLGLPERDMALFRHGPRTCSASSPGPADDDSASDRPMGDEELEARYTRIAQAWEYYGKVVEDRRVNPRDDLISALIEATTTASPHSRRLHHLPPDRAHGGERHDGQPDGQPGAVLRSVAGAARRGQARPVAARKCRRGGPAPTADLAADVQDHDRGRRARWRAFRLVRSCLSYGSGSNDEAHFPTRCASTSTARTRRAPRVRHGRHFCLGALARLEARVGLETLFDRIPDIRVVADQTLEYIPVVTVQTLVSLHVEWR